MGAILGRLGVCAYGTLKVSTLVASIVDSEAILGVGGLTGLGSGTEGGRASETGAGDMGIGATILTVSPPLVVSVMNSGRGVVGRGNGEGARSGRAGGAAAPSASSADL